MKHADKHAPPDSFKTAVITIEGVRGGTLIKRVPLTELRSGVTLDIEIVGRGPGTVTGTCMATDDEGEGPIFNSWQIGRPDAPVKTVIWVLRVSLKEKHFLRLWFQ